jgi:sugar phosphate isomerase/epimerase
MKKSINFDYKYDSTPRERLRLIEDVGFNGIYLHSQYNPSDYIDLVDQSSLEIESLHLPYKKLVHGKTVDSRYVNVLWEDDDKSHSYVDELIREINFAHEYGINIVVMHVTGGNAPPPMSEYGIKNIGKVLNLCEKYNITLCLENLRRLDYLDFAFERLPSDNLKFCFDSGHANCMTSNVDSFPWGKYKDKLCYLHLNDNHGMADQHMVPFGGSINWLNLIKEIYVLNPKLSLQLEVRSTSEIRERLSEREYLELCFDSTIRLQKILEA